MGSRKSNTDRGTSARNYAGGINVIIGGASFPVNFFPPRRSTDDVKLESCCPQCHTEHPDDAGVKTEVFYQCPAGHGPFKYPDLVRATKNDAGDLQVIGTVEEVKAVRGGNDDPNADEDEADKSFHLEAHLASKIEASTYPMGTPYVMRPVPGSVTALIPFFLEKIGHDGRFKRGTGRTAEYYTLIGHVTLRGKRKLMQIRTWNGQLVAQELANPDELHSFEPLNIKKDDRFGPLIDASLDLITEDEFDPENFTNESRKRLAEFAAARLADSNAVVIPMPQRPEAAKVDDADAMLLALEASVAAAKAKKGQKAS